MTRSEKSERRLKLYSKNRQKKFVFFNIDFLFIVKRIKNNYLIFKYKNLFSFLNKFSFGKILSFISIFKEKTIAFLFLLKKTFGEGSIYVRGLFIIFFIDACVTDDEPL
jgi:hypothetical protein